MLQSILVYGFMIVSMMALTHISAKYSSESKYGKSHFFNFGIIASLLIFAFFSGVRYDVGVDHLSYLDTYRYIKNEPTATKEWLYDWFTRLLSLNDINPAVWFGILAFVQLLFVFLAFKNEKYLLPFLVFTLMTLSFFTWMNGIRQLIVFCLFVFAIQYIKKKDLIRYLLVVAVGYCIHQSASLLILFFFVFFFDKDYFKSILLQLILIFVVLIISYIEIWTHLLSYIELGVQALGYEDSPYGEDALKVIELRQADFNRSIRFWIPLFINIMITLFSGQLKKTFSNSNFQLYYNIYFVGVLLRLLTYTNPLMARPFLYLTQMNFIMSAYFLYYLWKTPKHTLKLLLFFAIIILHLLVFYASILSDFHTQYKFIWDY